MHVMPPQMPVMPNALPQDAVAKSVPQIQAQASTPVIQRAIDPAPKSDRGGQTRSNEDRSKNGDKSTSGGRGSSVNLRV